MRSVSSAIEVFRENVWQFYRVFGRQFSWRHIDDPFKVVISEVMLQQTQVHRVAGKYELFITTFPDFYSLAHAPLHEVFSIWQGLGYNRRARFLRELAQHIVSEYNGVLPQDPEILIKLPGIGKATAASICAFAFNRPVVFIETNIRAVFIHTFFSGRTHVADSEIMPFVEQALDVCNVREWYYALMDYGVMIKKQFGNACRRSKHHAIQSKFDGSDRQIRGAIIKLLSTTKNNHVVLEDICHVISSDLHGDVARIVSIIDQLCAEKILQKQGATIMIAP